MTETFICTMCGEENPLEDCTFLDEEMLCPDCQEEHTRICDHCGNRIWLDDVYGDDDLTLCRHCRETYYETCYECGRLVEYNSVRCDVDGETYCEDCYNQLHVDPDGVQNYWFKPDPIFYGAGPRFMGVELEIDGAGENDEYANVIRSAANEDDVHIYVKHDGSLDDGFEIVTHPMTLDYHINRMPWKEVIQEALHLGYLSHKAGTCGLHVHVSRECFGITRTEQENAIARILYFIENHWHEMLKFSRRTPGQMEKWAARYGRKDEPKAVLDSAKRSSKGRYSCVNIENDHTIEFRMFRGTLKYNTLIATLQMVDLICDVALSLTDCEIIDVTWSEFVSGIPTEKYPELIQYLKERRLYINEPVSISEEV